MTGPGAGGHPSSRFGRVALRPPAGVLVEQVDVVPAPGGGTVVRIAGSRDEEGLDRPLPRLVAADAGREATLDALPAESGTAGRAWRAAFALDAASARAGTELTLLWDDGAGIPLPALPEDAVREEPRPSVAPERGGQVVDRAVLAERRARRAEMAEQAQMRIAHKALKALEELERRGAEVEARLAEAEAERDRLRARVRELDAGGLSGADAELRARVVQAEERAALLQAELREERTLAARAEEVAASLPGGGGAEDRAEANAELESLRARVRGQAADLAGATGALAILRERVEDLQAKLRASETARAALEVRAVLRPAPADAKAAPEELERPTDDRPLADAEQRLAAAEAALSAERAARRAAEAREEGIGAEVDVLRGEARAAQHRADALAAEVSSLREATASLTAELERLRAAERAESDRLVLERRARAAAEALLAAERAARQATERRVAAEAAHGDAVRALSVPSPGGGPLIEAREAAPPAGSGQRSAAPGASAAKGPPARPAPRSADPVAPGEGAPAGILRRDGPEAPPSGLAVPAAGSPLRLRSASEVPGPADPARLAADLDAAAAALRRRVPPRDEPEDAEPPRSHASSPTEATAAAAATAVAEPAEVREQDEVASRAAPAAPAAVDRGRGWLRGALVALAEADPRAAGRLLAGLLPLLHGVLDYRPRFHLTIAGEGTFAVTVHGEYTAVERVAAPGGRDRAAFHVRGDALGLAEVLAGRRRGPRRFTGPVRVTGDAGAARHLVQRLRSPEASADALLATSIPVAPQLVAPLASYAIDPAWTTGHSFCLAIDVGSGDRSWFLRADDGWGVTLGPEPPPGVRVDGRAAMSPAGFTALLAGAPPPQGETIETTGDPLAWLLLGSWLERARTSGAAPRR